MSISAPGHPLHSGVFRRLGVPVSQQAVLAPYSRVFYLASWQIKDPRPPGCRGGVQERLAEQLDPVFRIRRIVGLELGRTLRG